MITIIFYVCSCYFSSPNFETSITSLVENIYVNFIMIIIAITVIEKLNLTRGLVNNNNKINILMRFVIVVFNLNLLGFLLRKIEKLKFSTTTKRKQINLNN